MRHGRGGGRGDDLLRLATESDRQIQEVSQAFAHAHELGMVTVLWCYLRNTAFKTPDKDFHVAADLTGQANHLGVTIQADIIKQKLPRPTAGINALKFGKTDKTRLLAISRPAITRSSCAATRSPTATSAAAR